MKFKLFRFSANSFLFILLISTAFGQSSFDGEWKGILKMQGVELPILFSIQRTGDSTFWEIRNGKEKIKINEIKISSDSIIAKLPVFDSEFRLKLKDERHLDGVWVNHARKSNQSIPFTAEKGKSFNLFNAKEGKFANIDGKWQVLFSPDSPDSSVALGVFIQHNRNVTGTFLTPTGDYRYLEGIVDGDSLKVSTFDGSHAFLFMAKLKEGQLKGIFYSGNHWKEPWEAKRNEKYELPDPEKLTYLNSGYSKLDFKFPDLKGDSVSLSDKKFQNKVVIIQIMGSWCPNCMDETAFLSDFYKEYNKRGLEVIGLAYEKAPERARAIYNVERLQDRYHVGYTILLAGSSNKEEASKTLPMLNAVMSFPTTVFLDKKGKVRKIHTGFSGPATGPYYDKFVEDFTTFIEGLLKEN